MEEHNLKAHYCDFCGKHQFEVDCIIVARGLAICDECVDLCSDIVRERKEDKKARARADEGEAGR